RGRNLPRFRAPADAVHGLSIGRVLDVLGATPHRPLSLMIDNTLGGGTTLYRERSIRRRTEAGGAVLLWTYDFHRLRYFLRYVDIDRWRAAWGRCLQQATTILCFSESSRQLLVRAYPAVSRDAYVVEPHAVDDLPRRIARTNRHAPLHIGVVGEITQPKGAG